MLGLLVTMLSCSVLNSAREKLESMSPERFTNLLSSVGNASFLGGHFLKKELSESQRLKVADVLTAAIIALQNGDVTLGTASLLDRILSGEPLDPDPIVSAKMKQALADVVQLVEGGIGQFRVDVTGFVSAREKALLSAILTGLRDGLLA